MIYRWPDFLAVGNDLAHLLLPSPVSKLDRLHIGRLRKRYNLLLGEREEEGGGG
jgi:hypothetical protein